MNSLNTTVNLMNILNRIKLLPPAQTTGDLSFFLGTSNEQTEPFSRSDELEHSAVRRYDAVLSAAKIDKVDVIAVVW
jgi:hypothetical protein